MATTKPQIHLFGERLLNLTKLETLCDSGRYAWVDETKENIEKHVGVIIYSKALVISYSKNWNRCHAKYKYLDGRRVYFKGCNLRRDVRDAVLSISTLHGAE